MYEFRRLSKRAGLDHGSYSHALFVRHQPEFTRRMRRARVNRIARPHPLATRLNLVSHAGAGTKQKKRRNVSDVIAH